MQAIEDKAKQGAEDWLRGAQERAPATVAYILGAITLGEIK